MSDDLRTRQSDQRTSDFRRIAQLGDAWGERLDALGACHGMLRWLAGAARAEHLVERDTRYRALVKLLESTAPGEERREAFGALMASRPRLGKVAATLAAKRARAAKRAQQRAAKAMAAE